LQAKLDCTTRKLHISVGLVPTDPAALTASLALLSHRQVYVCRTSASRSLIGSRRSVIIQDLQHASSLNSHSAAFATAENLYSPLDCTDKTVSSVFVIRRLAPVHAKPADNRVDKIDRYLRTD
jgi:hypothetical protein